MKIRCIPFEFCPSCNWNTNRNLNFQIFSPFDRSSALELQFFALCPTFKRSQTHLSVPGRISIRPLNYFRNSQLAPSLKLHGFKIWKLGWLRITLSNPILWHSTQKTIGIETHSIFTFNIPDIYLLDDPTFQRRQPFALTSPLTASLSLPRLLIDLKTPLAFPINNRTMYSAAVNNEFPRFTFLSVHLALKLGRANSVFVAAPSLWKPFTLIEPKWFQARISYFSFQKMYLRFFPFPLLSPSKRFTVERA